MENFKHSVLTQSRHGKLILRNMQLGYYSALHVQKHLMGKSNLLDIRVLDLSNNNIRDQGLAVLSKSVGEENRSLISLNVSSNSITHVGLQSLVIALEKNQSLVELNLASDLEGTNCNKIGV